ncbi:MAG: hypothetical protein J5787_00420 [Alphaproteobacteria bacterium]|nr:hypothetical protein [Alphaproteobacteria bacterium]MBO4643192.1 hypothetical protein [Alphaproteobacteria bacterium]
MINSITLLSLLKPTFIFLFNRQRLIYLLTIPFSALIAVMILAKFFPLFYLRETVQPIYGINFYMLFLIAGSFSFFLLSVMLRTQQLVFFGDGDPEKKFFIPKPDAKLWRYFFKGLSTAFYSLFLSALLTLTLLSIAQYLLPLFDMLGYLFMIGTAVLFPYFFVRFIFRVFATAADQTLGWWEAWRMTRSINIMFAVLSLFFLFLPISVMFCVYHLFQKLFGADFTALFMDTFGVTFVFLIASVLMSAYSGYLYSLIKSKN